MIDWLSSHLAYFTQTDFAAEDLQKYIKALKSILLYQLFTL